MRGEPICPIYTGMAQGGYPPHNPAIAIGVALALSSCTPSAADFDPAEAKPLAELDLAGKAPDSVILLTPDEVRLRQGEKLTVSIDGAPAIRQSLRFVLQNDTLGVLRAKGATTTGAAIINITMPPPRRLVAAGHGAIRAEALAQNSAITVSGSGDVETMNIAARSLDVTIAGSGTFRAAGTVDRLRLTVTGPGEAAMEALKVGTADISVTGSGRSAFASDGRVRAKIDGAGMVTVRGRAICETNSPASGQLVCVR